MQLSFDLFNDELVTLNLSNNHLQLEPWELTLNEFLSMSEWKAFPDPEAKGEYKNNYVMQKPDGKKWPSGWIGKFRSEEQAKKTFHQEQIYYKLLWNADVQDRVLADYPKLLDVKRSIDSFMNRVHIGTGDYIRIELPERNEFFNPIDFPMFSRTSQRGFVKHYNLYNSTDVTAYTLFSPSEIACIALSKQLNKYGFSEQYRPNMINYHFNYIFKSSNRVPVRYQIPIDFDSEGNATSYESYEGITTYSFAYGEPIVEYQIDEETTTHLLLPSQVIAYQKNVDHWIDICEADFE